MLYALIAVTSVREMKQVDLMSSGHVSSFNDGNRKVCVYVCACMSTAAALTLMRINWMQINLTICI